MEPCRLGDGKGRNRMNEKELWNNLLKIKSTISPNKVGDWEIMRFEVSEEEARFHNLRCAIKGSRRVIKAGEYTKLTYRNFTVMSDTPSEIMDHIFFMHRARGDILINGLGLGVVAEGLMLSPDVKHLTIIEISSEVIQLVGPYLIEKYSNRLSIIHADAFEWKPPKGKIYDSVWHDIWSTICGDHYDSMKRLHRKYGRRTKYQDSWCKEEIRRAAKNSF